MAQGVEAQVLADKVSFPKEITKQHGFMAAPTTQARTRKLKYAEIIESGFIHLG